MTLTDDGRQFYGLATRALEAVVEAETGVGRRRGLPSGLLRLGTPVAFGRLHVATRMPAFLDRYPQVDVELAMSDGFVDLVEAGLDLAIRVGDLSDPSLIARRIGTTRRVTVASSAYLARRGRPMVPADLARHDCILYTRLATGNRWHFAGRDGPIAVDVSGRFRADNSEAVRTAVLGGVGIAVVPVWLFPEEIAGCPGEHPAGGVRTQAVADPRRVSIPSAVGRQGAGDDRFPRGGIRDIALVVGIRHARRSLALRRSSIRMIA